MGQSAAPVTILEAEGSAAWPLRPGSERERDDPIREVDAAVRAVLDQSQRASRASHEQSTHVYPDKLFSLRHAEALPANTRLLRIGPGTVVTPLARVLLRKQGISIVLGVPEPSRRAAAGEWAFSISVEREGGTIQALRRALVEDSRTWFELPSGLAAATDWLSEAPGRGVLFLSEEPAVAVWKACQLPGVRAASAHASAEVHSAAQGLGVNLLVVEPTGKSIWWIKHLAQAFRRAGAPEAPDGLMLEERPCE
jgi:hypothetical protein